MSEKKEKPFLSDKVLNRALKIMSLLILSLVFIFLLTLFSDFFRVIYRAIRTVLVPVALAWLISLIIYPVIKLFERRGIRPRALTVAVVYGLFAAVLVGFVVLLIPPVVEQVEFFFAYDYPQIVAYFSESFKDDFIFGPEVYDFFLGAINSSRVIDNIVEGFFDSLAILIPTTFSSVVTVGAVLPILLLFYLLDYERVNDGLRKLMPVKHATNVSDLMKRLNETVGAYIRGQLVLMITIGTVATIVYRMIGLEYYYLFGIIVGFLTVIPYFGVIIAMVPALSYAVITRDFGPNPLIILGVNLVLQFIEGNIFQPIIMGRQIKLHPIVIILSILFFGSLFGVIGVIFAAPLAATARVLFEFVKEQREDAAQRIKLFKEEAESS